MTTPGFTAEATLGKRANPYIVASKGFAQGRRHVLPALESTWFGPRWEWCSYNCMFACQRGPRTCAACIEECLKVS
jgi:hypothetical protein